MKIFAALCAVLACGLLSACGGGSDAAAAGTPEPAATSTSSDWDSWNWDEGGFSS